MNELLARAGTAFLAPAPPRAARRAPGPPPDLVVVLAPPGDLPAVTGGIAAALRRSHRAHAALVCSVGRVPRGRPAAQSARALAGRMAARELAAAAAGRVVHVGLPADPHRAARDGRRAISCAAGYPAVVAASGRAEGLDPFLSEADLLVLARRPDADPDLAALALGSLTALGPPVATVRAPDGTFFRWLGSLSLIALPFEPEPA